MKIGFLRCALHIQITHINTFILNVYILKVTYIYCLPDCGLQGLHFSKVSTLLDKRVTLASRECTFVVSASKPFCNSVWTITK